MGVSSSAKRGDARHGAQPSSHLPYEVLGVLLIALSLLTLLSLLSFSPDDAILFSSISSPSAPATFTHNMIGTAGATLASGLFRSIGGAAYLVPFLMAMLAGRCFIEGTLRVTLRSAGGSLASILFLSAFLHLEVTGVPTFSSGLVFRGDGGGVAGGALAETLRHYFANTGAHILILTGLLVSLLLATPASLTSLFAKLPVWWDVVTTFFEAVGEALSRQIARLGGHKARKPRTKPIKINRTVTPQDEQLAEEDEAIEEPVPELEVPEPVVARAVTAEDPDDEETAPVFDEVITEVATDYALPDPRELLSDPDVPQARVTDAEIKAQSDVLIRALRSFGIEGRVAEVHPGPVVTMYEFEPAPGVKVARIVNLDNDLALALKATSIRIVAPIPGKSVVGIEVPNKQRETVQLKEILLSENFARSRSKLTLALGKDIFGRPVTADLKTMPHLLVAGATGAGKSVSLNSMLLSVLCGSRPDEVKLLLIDPKMLEFQLYDGVPHLLRPVITDPKSAARGLGWVVQEMEQRYKLLAEAGVRNIDAYNRWVARQQGIAEEPRPPEPAGQEQPAANFLSEEDRLSAGETAEPDVAEAPTMTPPKTPPAPLPYILVMIDELADLMMVAPKDVEDKIARLAQMARAAGIHLVLATQRPSVDVLTGLIKANFPARIAFQVSSKTDSRTILDANGAEALLGRGDMLYLASGTGRMTRIHGSFVGDEDVRQVVEFIKRQAPARHHEELRRIQKREESEAEQEKDEVYEQAKDLVLTSGQASASLIQRRLRVGYPRAARMIERMEQDGIVGAPARDGRREVIGRRGVVGTVEE